MALDVLRQRLAGKAYAEAVAYTAQEFGCAQSAISAAWEVHNLEAFDALIDEMVKSGWEFTDDVRNLLKDIFPNGVGWE